jgi:hypothetical protein
MRRTNVSSIIFTLLGESHVRVLGSALRQYNPRLIQVVVIACGVLVCTSDYFFTRHNAARQESRINNHHKENVEPDLQGTTTAC